MSVLNIEPAFRWLDCIRKPQKHSSCLLRLGASSLFPCFHKGHRTVLLYSHIVPSLSLKVCCFVEENKKVEYRKTCQLFELYFTAYPFPTRRRLRYSDSYLLLCCFSSFIPLCVHHPFVFSTCPKHCNRRKMTIDCFQPSAQLFL